MFGNTTTVILKPYLHFGGFMNTDLLKAEARGRFDFGWLKTAHSFSFGDYYNPERMGFGQLKVVNDDWVEPGKGFDTHPHRNMEIISIPLTGILRHKDTLGHQYLIKEGEIQVMSAGTGIAHSEFNHSLVDPVNFLQIWIQPAQKGLTPSYQQQTIESQLNQWQTLVSPDGRDQSLTIHQDAYLSMIESDKSEIDYQLHDKQHGVYIFVIDGEISVDNQSLNARDTMMITDAANIQFNLAQPSKLLVIEVPVQR